MVEQTHFITKARYAAEAVREAIRLGEIAPGERIGLDRMAAKLGMSLTPIREALRLLEAEGLVEFEPHRGIRVVAIRVDEVESMFELRAVLEGFAIRKAVPGLQPSDFLSLRRIEASRVSAFTVGDLVAASQLTEAWHMRLYDSPTSTAFLREFILRLRSAYPWASSWRVPGRIQASNEEHRAILDAVEQADAEGAGELMERHILNNRAVVLGLNNDSQALMPTPLELKRPDAPSDRSNSTR